MANRIHPTAVIEGDVQLGDDNVIGPFCYLRGPLVVGSGNLLSSHVCLGAQGQDTRDPWYDDSEKLVVLGDRNIVREFTTVQKACYEDVTRIGNDVFLMMNVHVPHDAGVEDGAVVTSMSAIAGLCRVLAHATIAMHVSVTQHLVVGQYAMVAANALVRDHVRPFTRYIPGKPDGVNTYALRKHGLLDHLPEIEAYVADGTTPQTPALRAVVEHFDAVVADRADARRRISG